MSAPYVGHVTDLPSAGHAALEQRRQVGSAAVLESQAELGQLTDDEFKRRLEVALKGYQRMERIFETLMVDGVHYGTKKENGKDNVFKTPDLTLEGGQLLRQVFRLTPERVGDSVLTATEEYCEAAVTVQLRDTVGRIVAVRSGACNSQEPRFYERPRSRGRNDQAAGPIGDDGPDGELPPPPDTQALKADKRGKPLYTDAREVLHQCIAMAEKRANNLATADATGAKAFLRDKTRARMQKAQEAAAGTFVPWSQAEKDQVYLAADRAGVKTKNTLRKIVTDTLGHEPPATGDEVTKVLAAIALWTPPAPAKEAVKGKAAAPADGQPALNLDEQAARDREEDAELIRREGRS